MRACAPQIVYVGEAFPESWTLSIFLAGPSPRSPEVPSWRPEALSLLQQAGFGGAVFVPEAADGRSHPDYLNQVEWERQGLHFADRILFWVPRDLATLPGLTTNVEFGRWATSGKAILAFPPTAPKNKYLAWLAGVEGVPLYHTLHEGIAAAIQGWTTLEPRSRGERHVPLHVWQTEYFQAWYRRQRDAGCRLETAQLHWSSAALRSTPVAFILQTELWVPAEACQRHDWVWLGPDGATAPGTPERTDP